MFADLVWKELSNGNVGPIWIDTAVMRAVVGFSSIVSGKTCPISIHLFLKCIIFSLFG